MQQDTNFSGYYWKRPLTLNELLAEAEELELGDDAVPTEIVIFPPENDDITDEDSGDEGNVDINNLPGGQLGDNAEFMDMAPPAEHNSVDESMVPYYGRHPTKQFIRGKPIRWGYKIWTGTNRLGYIEWFEPYQGSNTKLSDEYKPLEMGASIVLEFVDALKASQKDMNYHIFFDNLLTSLPLLSELKSRGVKGTRIIRENRLSKNCPIVTAGEIKKQPRGNFDYATTEENEIVVCKWHDNSIVNIASNYSMVFPTIQVKRFSKKDNKVILVPQPHIIKIYNENMGGVDRADQIISLYRTCIRGKK
ncbi:piggyBac transposable element-derived protein 3-like [Anthonomus grandis grandis]|uniref:piggyBac transposable element-derived protein 3-like n=1 Tax=Anthonomus grandis grandis TaxID=2921223 RepID=UPI0021650F59|nr:piggyBac transposable element-derived protein 3-like [Anthonomus grandis grandis]